MPLPDITLDTRTFEQLFQDARRRIPVYAPEWTDHNESDPGIAFLQLVSWLQEMIIWRLNRVPDKTFAKFLDLVGIDLRPPSPAGAELTFTITAGANPDVAYPILKGTQVTLGAAGGGPPVIFETDDNLVAVVASIQAVQVYDAARFRLYPVENFALPAPVAALSAAPQDGCVFAIGFDVRLPEAAELRLLVHVAGRTPIPALKARGTARDTFAAPVQAVWEYSTGDPARWSPLAVTSDETRLLTRSGTIVVAGPPSDDFKAMPYGLRNRPGDELFWFRFRIVSLLGAGYETPPVVEDVLLNTIHATNAVTVRREVLGASTGLPNQQFRLANSSILPMPPGTDGRVEVREEETGGYELWSEVPNFDTSSREDPHYVLDTSSGVVRFGDGKHGKIPRALTLAASNDPQALERNIRATEYRWGGGARGNAGANTITGLQSSAAFVDRVTNLRPSIGGADVESLDDAKQRAPMTIRTMSRAVTPEDFAFLAQQTPGALISRAQAFPLLNPAQRLKRAGDGATAPELPLPGVVTVVVVPESTNSQPVPSADTLRLVADYLDKHRLLTTEVYVCAPRYRQVHVRAQVLASPSSDSGVVERTLRQRLLDYFHPLRGGRKGAGWEFGQTIDFSETYGRILNTPGVVSIKTESFRTFVDDEAVPACTDVPLEPDELVYSVDHEITVSYA